MKNNIDLRYFSVLSDLLLKSIRKQQTNVSKTLSRFFYEEFRHFRDQFKNMPVVYPVAYYELVNKAIEELAILKEKRNYLLEHATSGEIWLLGELQGSEISDETYSWMWRNIMIAIHYQQDDLIINHWTTCHQYYTYNLRYIHEEYDRNSDPEAVNKLIADRRRFIEFHYAIGGFLMYRERYSCIKRMFDHTQSQPPKYELLPESMDEIFSFYYELWDPYELLNPWISYRYPFPETSGMSSNSIVKKWIMSYMAVLFLRQYTIIPYLSKMRPLDFPIIPTTQGEIKLWIDGLVFFKKLLSEHLQNNSLLKLLNLNFITKEWCSANNKIYPLEFVDEFKLHLEQAYNVNAMNLSILSEKVLEFEEVTKEKIETTFDVLKEICNPTTITDVETDIWYISGLQTPFDKIAFSANPEIHYFDYESFLSSEVSERLKRGIGETFVYKKSKSYLLKQEDLFKAVDRLGIDEKFVIVNFGLNIDFYKNHLNVFELSEERYKGTDICHLTSFFNVRESIFILKKSDLPEITTLPIDADIIRKYSLNKISDKLNLYASVLDFNNTNIEVFNENRSDKADDELRKQVLLSVIISTEIKWKKNIEVIQLQEYSEYSQNGIRNKLSEVKSISGGASSI